MFQRHRLVTIIPAPKRTPNPFVKAHAYTCVPCIFLAIRPKCIHLSLYELRSNCNFQAKYIYEHTTNGFHRGMPEVHGLASQWHAYSSNNIFKLRHTVLCLLYYLFIYIFPSSRSRQTSILITSHGLLPSPWVQRNMLLLRRIY